MKFNILLKTEIYWQRQTFKIKSNILKQTIIYNHNNILNDYKTKDRDILSVFSIYVSPEDNIINELYKNNDYIQIIFNCIITFIYKRIDLKRLIRFL